MNRFVLTVACLLLLPTAVLSACGSCGDGAAEPAPLAEAPERADFSSLPEAANPFTKTPAGKDVAISALALPAKAPILLRLRSPNRLDAILGLAVDLLLWIPKESGNLLATFGPAGTPGPSFEARGLTAVPGETRNGLITIAIDETDTDADLD